MANDSKGHLPTTWFPVHLRYFNSESILRQLHNIDNNTVRKHLSPPHSFMNLVARDRERALHFQRAERALADLWLLNERQRWFHMRKRCTINHYDSSIGVIFPGLPPPFILKHLSSWFVQLFWAIVSSFMWDYKEQNLRTQKYSEDLHYRKLCKVLNIL